MLKKIGKGVAVSITPAGAPSASNNSSAISGSPVNNSISSTQPGGQASSESLTPQDDPSEMKKRLDTLSVELNRLSFESDGACNCRFALEPELTASIKKSLNIREPGIFKKALHRAGPAALAILTAGTAFVASSFIAAGIGGLAAYALSRHMLTMIQDKESAKIDAILSPKVEEKCRKVSEEVYKLRRKLSGEEKNENEWEACAFGAGLEGTVAAGDRGSLNSKGVSSALLNRLTPENLWSYRPGGTDCTIDTTPAVGADGTVYTATEGGKIVALKDGASRWEIDTGKSIGTSPTAAPDGMVYAYTRDGVLLAVKNGKLSWQFETGDKSSYAPPIVGPDGTVYAGGSGGKLFGVKDGRKVWEYDAGGFIQQPFFLSDGTFIVGTSEKLLAFRNGNLAWEYNDNSSSGRDPAPGPDGSVLVIGQNGVLHAVKDGKELWNIGVDMRNRPCTGPDGMVYVSSYEHSRSAICAIKDGKIAWEVDLLGNTVASAPAVGLDNTVYAQNSTGTLFAIKEGKKLWKAPLRQVQATLGLYQIAETAYGIMTPPVPGPDNTVFVNNYSRIHAVKDHMAASGEALAGRPGGADNPVLSIDDEGWLSIDGVKLPVNNPGKNTAAGG
jgi:outer membrane protein assembly factor BamB